MLRRGETIDPKTGETGSESHEEDGGAASSGRNRAGGVCLLPAAAWSTEGYFQLGYSPVQSALGGAGVANSQDAMSMALNPAGIAGVGRQFQLGVGLFMPYRGYTRLRARPRQASPKAPIESTGNLFLMPNMAYSRPIDADSAIGVVLYGNGGMNTNYKNVPFAGCPTPGVFCGGDTGVDLMQAFLSVDYAKRMGNFSFGIAPTLAVQTFTAKGLSAFTGRVRERLQYDQ